VNQKPQSLKNLVLQGKKSDRKKLLFSLAKTSLFNKGLTGKAGKSFKN
jgi:hypothetical protein